MYSDYFAVFVLFRFYVTGAKTKYLRRLPPGINIDGRRISADRRGEIACYCPTLHDKVCQLFHRVILVVDLPMWIVITMGLFSGFFRP